MPTIVVRQKDFEGLLGRSVPAESLASLLALVKGELKDDDRDSGEWRIELQDSNRPDLWCCEGIVRQIRLHEAGAAKPYAWLKGSRRPKHRIQVARGLDAVRPYIAACTATGYQVTDDALAQLIQTQEKLADIYGRKRSTVSIGLYQLPKIVFPVTYALVKPDEVRFTPLGFEDRLSLREILDVHPKGLEFGHLLAGHERVPVLIDEEGQALSFPPIINSREIGEVQAGDRELFVEVTGTDLKMVVLTVNLLAANLADRGAVIEPVEIVYPYATDLGKAVRTPLDFGTPRSVPIATIEAALGESLGAKEIKRALTAYGYEVGTSPDKTVLSVKLPAYRNDLMHSVDVVEDVAISRGYGTFAPEMPSQFTVGSLSRTEAVSDKVRDVMIGLGFQEIISNILGAREDLVGRMRLEGTEWERLVEVANVMTETYSSLRQWVLPSLLRVEAASPRAFYPHRLFEVGEVALPDETEESGTRTVLSLAAVVAHATANFSEVHSGLEQLLFYLDRVYSLEPISHPSFLEGRAGRILSGTQAIGLIGEIHPEVLERWQIDMPVATFELSVEALVAGTVRTED